MSTEQEYVEAFQRLVGEVFRLKGQFLTTAEKLARDLQITPARWMTIAVIRNKPMTAANIARRLGVTRQNTRLTVRKLEEQGLVEMRENPNHSRAPLFALTRKGVKTMELLYDRQAALTHHFTDGIGLDIKAMEKLTRQLEVLRSHAAELDEQL